MNAVHEGCDFPEKDSAVKVPCILGDCTIQLCRATTYEPPFYLFPELLEKVPEGTPALRVWDAVADVLDVQNSSWKIADIQALTSSHAMEKKGAEGPEKDSGSPSTAAHTLASLISSNRLLQAGLTPSVLLKGNFSAAKMLEELVQLKSRVGLDEQEGAVLMTNHFINLLAWRKLCDVNHGAATTAPFPAAAAEAATEDGRNEGARKRPRGGAEDEMLDRLRPCVDPWSAEVDAPSNAGVFISGREDDVERRVELLETLARLYRRPWRRLRSQGCQTDYVVPPGTINLTNPYTNGQCPGGGHGAAHALDVVQDLGWRVRPAGPSSSRWDGGGYAVWIRSNTRPEAKERRVDLNGSRVVCTTAKATATVLFGRASGVQYGISGNPLHIDVGLGAFTNNPQTLSTLHFALILRFVGDVSESLADPRETSLSNQPLSDEESGMALKAQSQTEGTHREGSSGWTVWLMSYGRNGVSIVRSGGETPRWVHGGDALQLHAGDEIVVGDGEVRVTLISTREEGDSIDAERLPIKCEEGVPPPAVKRESNPEDEYEA
ncbi:unnamed protein product [Phytomonas sp. EM1]|nr:unnamed protein product [Phytomonas sp. EM1]|eukprot:CCW62095.1 unnamed protein product [Phytomonas sp. isolate EM1]